MHKLLPSSQSWSIKNITDFYLHFYLYLSSCFLSQQISKCVYVYLDRHLDQSETIIVKLLVEIDTETKWRSSVWNIYLISGVAPIISPGTEKWEFKHSSEHGVFMKYYNCYRFDGELEIWQCILGFYLISKGVYLFSKMT